LSLSSALAVSVAGAAADTTNAGVKCQERPLRRGCGVRPSSPGSLPKTGTAREECLTGLPSAPPSAIVSRLTPQAVARLFCGAAIWLRLRPRFGLAEKTTLVRPKGVPEGRDRSTPLSECGAAPVLAADSGTRPSGAHQGCRKRNHCRSPRSVHFPEGRYFRIWEATAPPGNDLGGLRR